MGSKCHTPMAFLFGERLYHGQTANTLFGSSSWRLCQWKVFGETKENYKNAFSTNFLSASQHLERKRGFLSKNVRKKETERFQVLKFTKKDVWRLKSCCDDVPVRCVANKWALTRRKNDAFLQKKKVWWTHLKCKIFSKTIIGLLANFWKSGKRTRQSHPDTFNGRADFNN